MAEQSSVAAPGDAEAATAGYYARRAAEYDEIYAKPERQDDLAALRSQLADYFAGRRVLELACGTGYWTLPVAARAASVLGVDINSAVLDIARARTGACANVRLLEADLYAADLSLGGPFDAALAAHWWSHVRLDETDRFLDALHAHLAPGARVLLLDNRYVAGSSTPIARRDAQGNTYQHRRLRDGSSHEVLKNFPDAAWLERCLAGRAEQMRFVELRHYWYASYTLT